MKALKAFTALAVAGLTASLALADGTNTPTRHGPGGPGPLLEHLLSPRLVNDLNLTADQKTKYDTLEASFKKDAAAWDAAHPNFRDELRQAHEAGDKDAGHKLMEQRKPLMETRKGYVDQLRATLTDAQKATMDKTLDEMRSRMGKGQHGQSGDAPPKAPPAPPAE